ncbi:putative MORN repeat [Trypanosoma vivax]|uniref:Phosphatidylinositol 4-phosphate 5-kinase n=1 Tax=Trypanosoma vivax (strain Y486) TaxID=1055687 RepID=G0TZE5_TRYVY|nr:putative MORN repeat [Trypanosoma vivax]CCC49348.1 conserved hypothetical protein [Trypanosoma vivax Y486]
MSDSEAEGELPMELPQIWQFVHPQYARRDGDSNREDEEEEEGEEEGDEVQRKNMAPKLNKLLLYLNDIEEEEELEQVLQERDPVTQQTLLQWATRQQHYFLAEFLLKRAKRAAFGFPTDSTEMAVYLKWEEMRPELPSAAELQERQKRRDKARLERLAERQRREQEQRENDEEEEEEDANEEEEEEEEENEPLPEELVYDALPEYHDEWGDRGTGVVKQIGELGVYFGSRKRNGTKHGLGMALFPNGDAYSGEYDNNQRHGIGVYWWAQQGVIYTGRWHQGVRHGRGRIVYPDGSRYNGTWARDVKHGTGYYQYADGSSYDGAWVHNKKHGYGVYRFTDGSSFHGSFVDNAFTAGEWRLASGVTRYYGNFEKGVPVGSGVYVHRLGSTTHGPFQQEGFYHEGEWHPGVLYGTTRVPPRLEVLAPQQEEPKRVPMTFAPECNGGTMVDLVKAANFPPLQRWLKSLIPANVMLAAGADVGSGKSLGVVLSTIQVCSIKYDSNDQNLVVEIRLRPVLKDAAGKRLRLSSTGDETIILKERTTRLMVVLEETDTNDKAKPKNMVVLERSLQLPSAGPSHMQCRLPTVQITPEGDIEGTFPRVIQPALRVTFNRKTTTQLLRPLRSSPLHGDAEEDVILYVQKWTPDAIAQLEEKLRVASESLLLRPKTFQEQQGAQENTAEANSEPKKSSEPITEGCTFVCMPLESIALNSTDALTVIAATVARKRRSAKELPIGTVEPQRPPTPLAPAAEPCPELQPLYSARVEMMRAIEEGDGDEED